MCILKVKYKKRRNNCFIIYERFHRSSKMAYLVHCSFTMGSMAVLAVCNSVKAGQPSVVIATLLHLLNFRLQQQYRQNRWVIFFFLKISIADAFFWFADRWRRTRKSRVSGV